MDEEKWIEWVILYCKDELTPSDARALEAYLDGSEEQRTAFRECVKQYRRARQVGLYERLDDRRAWDVVVGRIRSKRGVRKGWRIARLLPYAAVAALLVFGSVYVYVKDNVASTETSWEIVPPGLSKAVLLLSDGREVVLSRDSMISLTEVNGVVIERGEEGGIRYVQEGDSGEAVLNTIRVPRGGEYYLQLPDGTRVWLNAESELTYAVSTSDETREVLLTGEAYFEVARDENKPFRVKSKDSRITVLGTKFNVMAYVDQRDVVTTLLDGEVVVSTDKDSLRLIPGEQSASGEEGIQVRKVDVRMYVAWKSGVFEFEEMALGEIARQLERWYDVTFVYSDVSLRDITFTGAADRHRSLDVILRMIEKLSKVRFELKEKVITVYRA